MSFLEDNFSIDILCKPSSSIKNVDVGGCEFATEWFLSCHNQLFLIKCVRVFLCYILDCLLEVSSVYLYVWILIDGS